MNLYQITTELKNTLDQIAENEGELSEDTESSLDVLSQELLRKTDGVCEWIKSQTDYLGLIRSRIDELKTLKENKERKIERFNQYVIDCLDRLGEVSIEGEFSKIQIRKPSTKVEIIDENEIPLEYVKSKTTITIDKASIAKKLKAGEKVPGARLTLGERKPSYKEK